MEANKDNLPFKMPALNFKLLAVILAVIAVAPFLRLIFLLGFVICWLLEKHKYEVLSNYYRIMLYTLNIVMLKAIFHFLYSQLKTIDGVLKSWNLVLITVMYLTRVLPAPW